MANKLHTEPAIGRLGAAAKDFLASIAPEAIQGRAEDHVESMLSEGCSLRLEVAYRLQVIAHYLETGEWDARP